MAKQFFHFGFRFREFVLLDDQFAREPSRFDRSDSFEDIERNTGHAD
jgi:hypothetical protein